MTYLPAARRPGLSLLEVIVALFVMALGMISLLTLFPLGAIQMGQALRDARAAETCSQGDTMMRYWWQQSVLDQPNPTELGYLLLDFAPPPSGATSLTSIDPNPSFPVAIDPLGFQARAGNPLSQGTLAQPFGGFMTRQTMSWITASGNAPAFSFRATTMMDDISFNTTATPDVLASGAGAPVVRQGRYNWAAIIQRPNNSVRNVADLKVLVFDGRPPGIATAGSEVVLNAAASAPVGTTQLLLTPNASVDYLRAGNWIMDGTINAGSRNAIWYRIQSIDTSVTPWVIDLQTPLLSAVIAPPATPPTQFYVFKGLIEVFDRPQLAPADYKRQAP